MTLNDQIDHIVDWLRGDDTGIGDRDRLAALRLLVHGAYLATSPGEEPTVAEQDSGMIRRSKDTLDDALYLCELCAESRPDRLEVVDEWEREQLLAAEEQRDECLAEGDR